MSAKLVGLLVDRKEQGQPGDFAGLQSAAEVLERITAELGPETAAALAALARKDEVSEALPGNACDATERDPDATLN